MASVAMEDIPEKISDGFIVGHYRIDKLLGEGGMGEVYLAEDTSLRRKVALKILRSDVANDKERLSRFEQEAFATSALNHPNILTIFEFRRDADRFYLVTEYVEGNTLRELINQKSLSLKNILDIILQATSALSAAHFAGIVHRDIKPENIIVRTDGLVKVLDFGLAKSIELSKQADPELPTLAYTNEGIIMGTTSYMSPEQLRSLNLDARTDIWSLGVCFYEMLTGIQPFKSESVNDTVASVLRSDPEPPLNSNSKLPVEIQNIVLKMLQKKAADRYQSAAILLDDLRSARKQIEASEDANNSYGLSSQRNTSEANAATLPLKAVSETREVFAHNSRKYLLGALAILIGITVILSLRGYIFSPNSSTTIESIAVLPISNTSGNADVDYLSEGITESLIRSLSQLPKLSVKARSSVFRYKDKIIEPQTVGNELSVQAVLTGNVSERNGNVSLSIELVDTNNGNVLWSEQYNRKSEDLATLQSEIAADISGKLRQRLSGIDKQRITKNYTENSEAYQNYLKGRFYWNKRTAESLKTSVEFFNKAIEADPNYALAYAGLAESYVIYPGFSLLTPVEAYPRAKAAAQKALELDETLAEAHAALGLALLAYDWNAAASRREFERAIELNPNYATAYHWYGNQNLLYTGHFEEALAAMKRAQELDPLSLVINTDVGDTYLFARQYDKAIEQFKKTIEMDKNFYYVHYELGMAYELKGMHNEAIAQYQKSLELNRDPRILGLLGYSYAMAGKDEEAEKILNELNERSKTGYINPYNYVVIYSGLKNQDKAFEYLEKSFQSHTSRMAIIGIDPFLDNLRNDPRLQQMINRVNLNK